MARCPNTVGGAKTTVRDTQGGVELEISVAPESLAELRTRAKYQADVSTQTPASSSDHAGKGTGGGAFGRCPVVAFDTKVTYADTPTGVKLTVLANDSSRVEWLRKETRSRDRDLNARTDIADAGQRKMANCPSAAAGAKTVVKEQKGSMVITVTGADDGAVKEIRARAGRLVEASKAGADPTAKGDARHTGGGTGGGSLGSCPVVLAETSVAAKEVAGGTEITVKPRKAADFSSLKKETLERQERWSVAAKGNK
jgi:TusA-related sulfurtransferase